MIPNLALHSLLKYTKRNYHCFDDIVVGVSRMSGVSYSEIKNWSDSQYEGSLVDSHICEWAFEYAVNLTNNTCLGIDCSELTRSHGLETYLLALLSAKNTGDAIGSVLVNYVPQLVNELFLRVESDPNRNMLVMFGSVESDRDYKYLIDFCLSLCIRLARRLPPAANLSPVSLALKRDCPEADISRFQLLYNCPVIFSANQNLLELGPNFTMFRSELAGGIPQNFTDFLIKKASVRKGKSFCQKTQKAIEDQLTQGVVNIEGIASKLNVSSRTLQQRLASEGESFRNLLEQASRRRALYFLTHTSKSISQISDALGYTTEASFIRAFRRWEGTTPAAFRKNIKSK